MTESWKVSAKWHLSCARGGKTTNELWGERQGTCADKKLYHRPETADDCALVAKGNTLEEARQNMIKALDEYHTYATANRILPEPEKNTVPRDGRNVGAPSGGGCGSPHERGKATAKRSNQNSGGA
eukprot:gene16815-biopygen17289